MDKPIIESALDDNGELLVTLDSGQVVELHLHDTTFGSDGVTIELADGQFSFPYSKVESYGIHLQETEDLGI